MFASKQPNSTTNWIVFTSEDVKTLITLGELFPAGIRDTLRERRELTIAQDQVLEKWYRVFYWGVIVNYPGIADLPVTPVNPSRAREVRNMLAANLAGYARLPQGRFLLGLAPELASEFRIDRVWKFGPVAKLIATRNAELFLARNIDPKKLFRFVNRLQNYFVEIAELDAKVKWHSSKIGSDWWERYIPDLSVYPQLASLLGKATSVKKILQGIQTNILQLLTVDKPVATKYLAKKLKQLYV